MQRYAVITNADHDWIIHAKDLYADTANRVRKAFVGSEIITKEALKRYEKGERHDNPSA